MELLRKKRAEASRRIAKIGWAAVGGMALITVVVLMVVWHEHIPGGRGGLEQGDGYLDAFLETLERIDFEDESQLLGAKDLIEKERKLWKATRIEDDVIAQLAKINSALQRISETRGSPRQRIIETIIKTRALRESLDGIEAKLTDTADLTVLSGLFTSVRDADLQMQATDAGGEWKTRYEETRLRVTERYIESLRGACRSAATATSGDGLAPFGTLEDLLRTVVIEARAANDVEAIKKYDPMYVQLYGEINAICSELFDDAYQNKVAWTDLLTDPGAWTAVTSSSFTYRFGPLTMTNAAGDSSQSGGISYFPAGDNWRDYVLQMEFKLDSGVMVVYTRVGEKMDTKDAPGFSVGGGTAGRQVQVVVDYGKMNTMMVSTIGNQLTVKLDDQIVLVDDIKMAKSRKGEPGIVAKAGPSSPTNLTITRLRARLLR
jgi:hypothetical protein